MSSNHGGNRSEIARLAIEAITGEAIGELALELARRPSPAGHERDLAKWLTGWITERSSIAVSTQMMEGDRANVLLGNPSGPNLAFYGHLDTSLTGDLEIDGRLTGNATPITGPEIRDGVVWGLGIAVSKGPLAAGVVALLAIHRAIEEAGRTADIGALFVSGGTHRAVPPWPTSPAGAVPGEMAPGVRAALASGFRPGAVINIKAGPREPLYEEPGLLYVALTVGGRWGSAASMEMATGFSGAAAALVPVVQSMERWRDAYLSARADRPGQAGAEVSLGAIEAGLPSKPDFHPFAGRALISIVTHPEDDHDEIVESIGRHLRRDDALRGFAEQIAVDAYGSLPAGRTDPSHRLYTEIARAWERTIGPIGGDPYKGPTDGALLRAEGIPTVRAGGQAQYDPDDRRREGFDLDELAHIAHVWAEASVTYLLE